jgi:hypothetical protein
MTQVKTRIERPQKAAENSVMTRGHWFGKMDVKVWKLTQTSADMWQLRKFFPVHFPKVAFKNGRHLSECRDSEEDYGKAIS